MNKKEVRRAKRLRTPVRMNKVKAIKRGVIGERPVVGYKRTTKSMKFGEGKVSMRRYPRRKRQLRSLLGM